MQRALTTGLGTASEHEERISRRFGVQGERPPAERAEHIISEVLKPGDQKRFAETIRSLNLSHAELDRLEYVAANQYRRTLQPTRPERYSRHDVQEVQRMSADQVQHIIDMGFAFDPVTTQQIVGLDLTLGQQRQLLELLDPDVGVLIQEDEITLGEGRDLTAKEQREVAAARNAIDKAEENARELRDQIKAQSEIKEGHPQFNELEADRLRKRAQLQTADLCHTLLGISALPVLIILREKAIAILFILKTAIGFYHGYAENSYKKVLQKMNRPPDAEDIQLFRDK